MHKKILTGYFYTFLGTISFSSVYVFSKAALNEISLPLFLFVMTTLAFIVNLIILLHKGGIAILRSIPIKNWWLFPTLGTIEILTVITFYASINAIKEPAVTGFLGNLFPLFTTIMGVIFLRERFSPIESVGIFIVFAGAILTSYSGDIGIQNFFIPGIGLVMINCLGAATATVLVRAKVNDLSPEILSFNRVFWLLLFFTCWIIIAKIEITLSYNALINTMIASILEPILAILFIYKAYRYIEASRGTIIQSTKGLVIIPVSYLFFGTLPLAHQIAGGIISMIGVIVIGFGQHALIKKK